MNLAARAIRIALLWLVTCCLWLPIDSSAQTPEASPQPSAVAHLQATSVVAVNFPVGMTIAASLAWPAELAPDGVSLTYTVAGDATEHLAQVDATLMPGANSVDATATLDLQSPFVPSGIVLAYTWQLVQSNEVIAESGSEQTSWYDTRWSWTTIASEQVRVHSYKLSPAFAQLILNSGQGTVTDLERRFGLEHSAPLDIWVYDSLNDLLGAQQANSRESIAGASYPGYNLIVALIPEGSNSEIGRIIPHEVSHQVLYQATKNPFTYPPIWFDEGMATHMQIGGTDGYPEMVQKALAANTLFQLPSLEVTFPYSPAQATLAYAASWSAIQYIQETYGDEGISALIRAYRDGRSNEEAVQQSLGVSVEQLSADWQAWIRAGAQSVIAKD